MMNMHAKRNKYRGLRLHIEQHYDVNKNSVGEIHEALQVEDRWAGVGLESVKTAVYSLRNDAAPKYRKHRANGKTKMPDVLVTIPLPKRQSATMTVQEAYVVFKVLKDLFADK